MMPCTICGEPLPSDPERTGARCPRCREPLYEPGRDPHRLSAEGGRCAAHPHNGAVATCQRCGNYLCAVCWTRWQQKAVCAGCVNRALEAGETMPAEAKAHLRQAVLAVIFGVLAWLVTLAGFLLAAAGMASGFNEALLVLGGLALLLSPLVSVVGVGQAAAAIRARGDHMIMATIGLILAGLHSGMLVGLFTFSIWNG